MAWPQIPRWLLLGVSFFRPRLPILGGPSFGQILPIVLICNYAKLLLFCSVRFNLLGLQLARPRVFGHRLGTVCHGR